MELYNYLKELYSGKNAIFNHITLFSLLGIMIIFLNNLFAIYGSSIYFDIFAVPPSSSFGLWVALVGGVLSTIYLFGYEYQYINSLFKRDECSLLDFTFEPFGTFFRIFPMFFLWQNYMVLLSIAGTLIILAIGNNDMLYILYALVISVMPFVHMVLISFSSRFKYRLKYFYPWLILQYIDKTLGDVISLFFQVMLLLVLPIILITAGVFVSKYITNEVYQYGLELLCLCTGVYCFVILKYVFSVGLVKLVKEKLRP